VVITIEKSAAEDLSALGFLLEREAPAAKAQLVAQYPNLDPELARSKTLGSVRARSTSVQSAEEEKTLARAYLETAKVGLDAADALVARLLVSVPHRIHTARKLKLVGGVVSSISSAGVLSTLALAKGSATAIAAVFALAASLLAIVGEHLETPIVGTKRSAGQLITELLHVERDIKISKLELVRLQLNASVAEALAAAKNVNGLAAKLRYVEVVERVSAPRREAEGL
jgi:hypothetical protein